MANPSLGELWQERINSYRNSGLTMEDWCAANGFTLDQLKYWLYKGRKKSPTQAAPTFLPVAVSSSEPVAFALWIHVGSARIEVTSGFEPQLLREVVEALRPHA